MQSLRLIHFKSYRTDKVKVMSFFICLSTFLNNKHVKIIIIITIHTCEKITRERLIGLLSSDVVIVNGTLQTQTLMSATNLLYRIICAVDAQYLLKV